MWTPIKSVLTYGSSIILLFCNNVNIVTMLYLRNLFPTFGINKINLSLNYTFVLKLNIKDLKNKFKTNICKYLLD